MTRALRLVRLAWGATLLAAPGPVLAAVRVEDPTIEPVVRVLGARNVLHALALDLRRTGPAKVSASIDAAHAASMFAAAALLPRRRRAAIVSGGLAGVWTLIAAWRARDRSGAVSADDLRP